MKLKYKTPSVKFVMVEMRRAIAQSWDVQASQKVNDDPMDDAPSGFGDDFWGTN